MQRYICRVNGILILIILTLAGCQAIIPAPPPTPTPIMSQWGRVGKIAQAPQTTAPAFTIQDDQLLFAWVASDTAGVHQDVRTFNPDGWSQAAALPLNPIRPDHLMTFAAVSQQTHLLYLDEASDTEANTDETRLYHALVRPDRGLAIGGTLLSPQRVYHYSAISLPDHALWVVWSGGLRSEPRLYARYIDPAGRPRSPLELAANADYPTLLRGANGDLWLFWLQRDSNQMYRAHVNPESGELSQSTIISESHRLALGERLISFSAAADLTHGYLFWNTVTAEGVAQTWMTAGEWAADSWDAPDGTSAPRLLGLEIAGERDFQTGYNGGSANTATLGETPVTWVAPVPQASEVVLAAGVVGDALGVLYLRSGEIVAFQPVITLDTPLIGLPQLAIDRERHLYLAWSAPTHTDYADLWFTMTRPDYTYAN